MNIDEATMTKEDVEVVAGPEHLAQLSVLIMGLKCACGFSYAESLKEPCLCTWTPIEDWFLDHGVQLGV